MREGESANEECDDLKLIANFISNVELGTEWKAEGGITWLEIYILYRIHSPKIEVDPLATDKPLLKDIANFKAE